MNWLFTDRDLPNEFLPVFLKKSEDDSFETAEVGCFLTEEGGHKGWWIGDKVKVISLDSRKYWMPIEVYPLSIPVLEDKDYASFVTVFLVKLASFERRLIRLNSSMLKAGNNIYPMDYFISGIIDRSISLIYGFETLIRTENFLAASHLVRPHLDNFIRLSTLWMVEDPILFVSEILKGKQINHMQDAKGKTMSDRYLKDMVSKEHPWISSVYDETSGFIHFSKKHIYNTIQSVDIDLGTIESFIGKKDRKVSNQSKLEAIICMIDITNHIVKQVFSYILEKRQ